MFECKVDTSNGKEPPSSGSQYVPRLGVGISRYVIGADNVTCQNWNASNDSESPGSFVVSINTLFTCKIIVLYLLGFHRYAEQRTPLFSMTLRLEHGPLG